MCNNNTPFNEDEKMPFGITNLKVRSVYKTLNKVKSFLCAYKLVLVLIFLIAQIYVFAQKPTEPFSCYAQKSMFSHKSAQSLNDLRSDTIDIKHTSIHLDLSDWSGRQIKGFSILQLQAKQNNVNYIALDLLKLTIDSIKFNGVLTNNYTYNDTLLKINFSSVLSNGQNATVSVFYHGNPVQNAGDWGGFYWNGTYAYNVGVSFQEDPHNYGRVWFPCYDNFVERSTFDFAITTNSNRKAFCNGLLTNEIDNGNSTKTWYWQMNQEIPSYLASVAVSDYATVEMSYNGLQGNAIPIQMAARVADTTNLKNSFVHLPDALECYENSYLPYAFDRVGYCLTSFTAGAMEHATNITYMRAAVNGTTTYETLMAHELSHHWWGDLITCRTAEDMWLNEGWASYSEALFTEYVYGTNAYKIYNRERHDGVLRTMHIDDGGYYAVSGVPTDLTYSNTVYQKGADMAQTLRGILGDNLFFSCISSFLNSHKFTDVSSHDFEQYLSTCSGRDLSSFFNTWIFEKGFHHYSISDINVTQNGANYEVQGSIKQKLWENTSFTQNLPIEVYYFKNDGSYQMQTVNTIGDCTSFSITLNFEPVYIALDLEEKIQDATVDNYLMVGQTGTVDFGLARVVLNVYQLNDSNFVHATHHYIKPDAFKTVHEGLHLSPNRYWSIGGVWENNFEADAIFKYNGSTNQTNGYLDNDLITNSEDSLVILYKAKPQDEWTIVDSFAVETQGSALNKVGQIRVYNLKQGDYVLAIYDKNVADEATEVNTCVYTNIREIETTSSSVLKVYPVPANNHIVVEKNMDIEIKELAVYDSTGKQVYKLDKDFDKSINIDVKNWSTGIYYISTYDKNNSKIDTVSFSKK